MTRLTFWVALSLAMPCLARPTAGQLSACFEAFGRLEQHTPPESPKTVLQTCATLFSDNGFQLLLTRNLGMLAPQEVSSQLAAMARDEAAGKGLPGSYCARTRSKDLAICTVSGADFRALDPSRLDAQLKTLLWRIFDLELDRDAAASAKHHFEASWQTLFPIRKVHGEPSAALTISGLEDSGPLAQALTAKEPQVMACVNGKRQRLELMGSATRDEVDVTSLEDTHDAQQLRCVAELLGHGKLPRQPNDWIARWDLAHGSR